MVVVIDSELSSYFNVITQEARVEFYLYYIQSIILLIKYV